MNSLKPFTPSRLNFEYPNAQLDFFDDDINDLFKRPIEVELKKFDRNMTELVDRVEVLQRFIDEDGQVGGDAGGIVTEMTSIPIQSTEEQFH